MPAQVVTMAMYGTAATETEIEKLVDSLDTTDGGPELRLMHAAHE